MVHRFLGYLHSQRDRLLGRGRVLSVKRGGVAALDDVVREIDEVRDTVEAHLRSGDTPLRPEADLAAVSGWATSAHRRHWGWG